MKKNDFILACNSRCISPNIVMENDNLVNALKNQDDERVISILDNEF